MSLLPVSSHQQVSIPSMYKKDANVRKIDLKSFVGAFRLQYSKKFKTETKKTAFFLKIKIEVGFQIPKTFFSA